MKKLLVLISLVLLSAVGYAGDGDAVPIGKNSDGSADVFYNRNSVKYQGDNIQFVMLQRFDKPFIAQGKTILMQVADVTIHCSSRTATIGESYGVNPQGVIVLSVTINRTTRITPDAPFDRFYYQYCH